jgi:hypothetical protein
VARSGVGSVMAGCSARRDDARLAPARAFWSSGSCSATRSRGWRSIWENRAVASTEPTVSTPSRLSQTATANVATVPSANAAEASA